MSSCEHPLPILKEKTTCYSRNFFCIHTHDKIFIMKSCKKNIYLRSMPALLFAMLTSFVAASEQADLYLGESLVYSCQDFINEQGAIFLPLQESTRALGIEGFSDPQSRTVFFRYKTTLVMIDSAKKEVTVTDKVAPIAHVPLWTRERVFVPQEVFTEVLAQVMETDIRIIHQNDFPGKDQNRKEKICENGTLCSVHRNPIDVIVIDPGHGGEEAGARGPGDILEKDVTLEISKKLRHRLAGENGLIVHLTRDDDVNISLSDRPRKADELSADVFVSIHANGFKRISTQGFETFFASLTATDQAALDLATWENQVETGEINPADEVKPDLEMILGDMAQTEFLADSERLAEMIQEEMARVMNSDNRGVKQAPFKVLMESTMPAVLVEVGFITCPSEARMITDPEMQERIVGALANAILKYRDQTNARLGLVPNK